MQASMNFVRSGVVISSVAAVISLGGCGKSDAQRMEEYRQKYASAGVKDSDEEEEASTAPAVIKPTSPPPAFTRAGEEPAPQSKPNAAAAPPPSVTGQAVAPAELTGAVTDTKAAPATPLSEVERRQITIDNLQRISAALEMYREGRGGASYPAQYVADRSGSPLLSWRVVLLPYLGYEDLYKQFKLNEPWDTEHNRALVEKIPSVYQSPERFDVFTNYVVAAATGTGFFGHKPKGIRRWEDGLENTIIVAEVDDDHSVVWTQPEDLKFDALNPRKGLGTLRNDGFFAMWGGGAIQFVPNSGGNVRVAFTVDDGEAVSAGLKRPATADPSGLAASFRKNTSAKPMTNTTTQPGRSPTQTATTNRPGQSQQYASSGQTTATAADAQEAFSHGREAEAMRLYYAGIASAPQDGSWVGQFMWIPGLSRPAPAVRYGVGIEFRGTQASSIQASSIKALFGNRKDVSRVLNSAIGKFGYRVVEKITSRPLHTPFLVEIEPPRPQRRRRSDDDDDNRQDQTQELAAKIASGIQFIGADKERTLIAAARKHEVDVLLVFHINEKSSTRGNRVRKTRVKVIDVVRRKTLYTTESLNNRQVLAAKIDLVADDPTPDVLDALGKFIDKSFTPTSLPSGLNRKAAIRRVEFLGSRAEKNPLRTIAEIQLYRQLGLISLSQQQESLTQLLGESASLTLLAGNVQEKRETLETHLR